MRVWVNVAIFGLLVSLSLGHNFASTTTKPTAQKSPARKATAPSKRAATPARKAAAPARRTAAPARRTAAPARRVAPSKQAAKKPLDPGARLRKRVVEFRLPNGMLFLLVKRTGAPTFSAYIRVRVGGVDEISGYTGLAHIFEHMAFKGTTHVGSKDWAKEKVLLKKITRVGETLSREMALSKGKITPEIAYLQGRLKALQQLHKKAVKTDEFTRIYSANGGVGLNATTSKDLTSYFVSLPANRLELWARQEAGRLIAPVFREYYRERAVVAEERRMAMSRGGSRLYEKFIATAFIAHPYRFPTVGWMSDITTIPLASLRRFYKMYYAPSNMIGTIVGDIDIQATKALLSRTFGLIPKGPKPPAIRTVEPKQDGERRVNVRFHTSPQVLIGWHKPTAPHPHDDVFDVIEALLTHGRSSRLYRALVKKKFAEKVWASGLPGARFANVFTIGVTPIAPHSTRKLESLVYAELERLKKEPVSARELQTIHNKIAMSFLRGLRSNNGLAEQLSYFQATIGDWKYATHHAMRLRKVTPKAIMAVARKYFRTSNRTVATLVQHKPRANKGTPFGRRKAGKKLSLKQRRTALLARLKALIGHLRGLRKKKMTKAQKAEYVKLIKQARKMAHALRGMDRLLASQKQAPKAKKRPDPKRAARHKAMLARVKAMLARTQDVPVTIRPLPASLQAHPNTLKFKPLRFSPPKPKVVRLSNGMTLYLLEDRELPLIDIYAIIKTGRIYDPKGKIGVGEMTGRVMRSGGFGSITGDKLDEAIAFRAAQLSSSVNAEHGSASLAIHRKDLKWGLKMLSGMLRNPRFPKDKINLERVRMMERLRRYNDQPFRLAIHQFRKLIYGPKHRLALKPSPRSIVTIKRPDLVAFHGKYYHPNNIRLAVVGDFSSKAMLAELKKTFGSWTAKKTTYAALPPVPKTTKPAVVMIEKQIPQSVLIVGHLGPRRHDPQLLAGKVMNQILGSGGFSSRLMTEIRTRRGLAYFAGSELMEATDRGIFAAYTGTRPNKTAKALHTLLGVVKDMANTGKVSAQELSHARKTLLNGFVFRFQSPSQIVYRKAYYDYFGYPQDYLEKYRSRLLALKPEDLKKAAQAYIKPKQFIILVVGQQKLFDRPLSSFGKVKHVKID